MYADFRHDNGKGIRNVCRRFVELCRKLKLFAQAIVAIDGERYGGLCQIPKANLNR